MNKKTDSVELLVIIQTINKVETYGQFNYEKRTIIIKTISEFPQELELQLNSNHIHLGDEIREGQTYIAHVNLKGGSSIRDGKRKYFTTLHAWKFTNPE